MSDLVPTNIQIPAHLASRIGKTSAVMEAAMSGVSGGGEGYPRISIKSSRFRILEDGTETVLDQTALDVVIVGANIGTAKSYYASEWTKDSEPKGPDCFSYNGVRPHSTASNPQHDTCAGCPHNAYGSKVSPNGQPMKACADQRRLAVVAADDPDGPIYLMIVPPASLKNWNTYVRQLGQRQLMPEICRTRIGFDPDASFPKLMFKFGGLLDETTQDTIDQRLESPDISGMCGNDGDEGPKEEAAPKPVLVKAAPKAEPEEEAKPARGFGAKKADNPEAAPKPKAEAKKAPLAVVEDDNDFGQDIVNLLAEEADDA